MNMAFSLKRKERNLRILKATYMIGILVTLFIPLLTRVGAQEVSGYTVITTVDLKKMQDSRKEMLLIDTLAGTAYKNGHIPDAKNFEFPNGNMDPWDTSKTAGRSKDDFVALLGGNREKLLVFYCSDEK
jgi:3-mercaptopyruvate sulfurtransferase SseA